MEATFEENLAIIGDIMDVQRKALEACAAWHWAEREGRRHGFTFNDCMELCNYSEWMTLVAIGMKSGDDYQGIPHIMLRYPGIDVSLVRKTEPEAQAIVDRIIELWKQER